MKIRQCYGIFYYIYNSKKNYASHLHTRFKFVTQIKRYSILFVFFKINWTVDSGETNVSHGSFEIFYKVCRIFSLSVFERFVGVVTGILNDPHCFKLLTNRLNSGLLSCFLYIFASKCVFSSKTVLFFWITVIIEG